MFTHRSVSKVKANISSKTKAHLLRAAFYVLLLMVVCAVHFALGQQSVPDRVYRIHAPRAPTPTSTPTSTPTASPTPTATATPPSCVGQYMIKQIGGSIVPGTTDIGNHSVELVT